MKKEQFNQLLYEALETEIGGVQVYENAIQCAVNDDLKEEWQKYLGQTQKHEQIVRGLFEKFGLDAEAETPGRSVVRHIGASLVKAMQMAREAGEPNAAQIVAAECVVEAETKDHLNWELLAQVAEKAKAMTARSFAMLLTKSRMKKTSTFTIPPDGVASCGYSRLDCRR